MELLGSKYHEYKGYNGVEFNQSQKKNPHSLHNISSGASAKSEVMFCVFWQLKEMKREATCDPRVCQKVAVVAAAVASMVVESHLRPSLVWRVHLLA